MSLHNGIDIVAVATIGIYTKTYGSADKGAIANLYASIGLLEDAPDYSPGIIKTVFKWFLEFFF